MVSGDLKECGRCGRALWPGEEFCAGCGRPGVGMAAPAAGGGLWTCERCGRLLWADERICAGCGAVAEEPAQPARVVTVRPAAAEDAGRRRAWPLLISGALMALGGAGAWVWQRQAVHSSGTLVWSGELARGGLVTIEGAAASTGMLRGVLPGVAVRVQVRSADVELAEPPAAAGGWRKLVLRARRGGRYTVTIAWTML